MDFRILGALEVVNGDAALSLGGPKQRTVLVHLLLRANRLVSFDQLIDWVWGEDPPPAARSSLQSYVSHLRRALGPQRLEGRSRGYVLRAAPTEIDAARFERLLQEARSRAASDPVAAVAAFNDALGLWRGPALADLTNQASLQPDIARLEELRMAATEERIAAELSLERHGELIPELATLVQRHPFRERLWEHLTVALYRAGRQSDALAAYGRARDVLAEELGIDPSPRLQRLHERILRHDPALEFVWEPLRGYRLLELIGEGGFGAVRRAFQPQVGREVAVKIIHPRFAHDPEFIRSFEAEAHLVARLEHPHIVPLYDYWRDPEGAYLVMRYLRGGSLREALARGPLGAKEVARLLDQIALALSAAHRRGVVHRDVKPANILFDEDNNAYLSDFGIAKDLATTRLAQGDGPSSPLAYYTSPEEIRGEPATPRTDVYSLGLLIYETLAGHHPFSDSPPEEVLERHLRERLPDIRSELPDIREEIHQVIEKATAKAPTARYVEAAALAAAFRDALAPAARPAIVPTPEIRNPYKGLRPFVEADEADFFGREALVAELLAHLADDAETSRFLAVVGPSGSGKSSIVKAGLIPALRRGELPGSDRWFAIEMHPGAHPFEELAAALTRISVEPRPDLVECLERGELSLVQIAADIVPPGSELVVVIDQFEEVFTLVDDEDKRNRFLRLIATSAIQETSVVRVVITLRADLYDKPLTHPGLAELVKARTVTVTPLRPEELERAVTGPAKRVGVEVESALVARVAAEVADQAGALPLLQYALTEMFDRAGSSMLTVHTYREIGGAAGALVGRAEALYARLTEAGKQAARQMFLRLVTLGDEGRDDTRRRVLRVELTSMEVDREAMEDVVDTFGARRLLSLDRDPVTRGPTVEVAHEALLREWARLRGWIEGAREDVRAHRRLASAAMEWAELAKEPGYLLRGAALARVETWVTASGLALTADERAYLEASLARRDTERAEEEARSERERALERRSFARLRALVAVLTLATVVAGGLTAFAVGQRGRAEREARIAAARELAAAAVANLEVDPERSILLALEAIDATRETDGFVVRAAEEALHRAVKASRIIRTVPHGGHGLAVTSDGTRFVTTGSTDADNIAAVWDTDTGEELLVVSASDAGRATVALSPDDRLIATAHDDGTTRLWDVTTGRELHVLRGHRGPQSHPAFSPDGKWLAVGGKDGIVRVWNVASGAEEIRLTGHERPVLDVAFSPDGSRLATGSDDTHARIWDLATGDTLATLKGHEWGVTGIDFSPDGTRVVTAALDASFRIWDAGSGALVRSFNSPADMHGVDYSPDGTRVATAGSDGVARIWDADTGRELLALAGHTGGGVVSVSFTPDDEHLLTAGVDGTTRLWDISVAGGRDWLTVPGAELIFVHAAFSPDGRVVAAPAEPSDVTIWDTETGDEVIALTGHGAKLTTVAFSPDGTTIAAGSDLTFTPPVWDVGTGELLFTLKGHKEPVRAVAFSPDGGRLVTGSWDGTARVWDATTGEQQDVLEPGRSILSVAFSPDGRFIVTGEDRGIVTIWDAGTLEELRQLRGHSQAVVGVAFGPDGLFATASEDGTATAWDFASGEERVTFRSHSAAVNQVAISPDGRLIATASDDLSTRLWDPATGEERLSLFGHNYLVSGVIFSPDGRLLATASPDGTVALHLLPIDEFETLARERVTRALTDEECRQYLHLEGCPTG